MPVLCSSGLFVLCVTVRYPGAECGVRSWIPACVGYPWWILTGFTEGGGSGQEWVHVSGEPFQSSVLRDEDANNTESPGIPGSSLPRDCSPWWWMFWKIVYARPVFFRNLCWNRIILTCKTSHCMCKMLPLSYWLWVYFLPTL